jgi:preprotein translocase subunit SecE
VNVAVKNNLGLFIWIAVIGALFGFAWRQGYLMRVSEYLAETREELRKCAWPSNEELWGSTKVVMVTMLLLTAFTVIVDLVVTQLVRWVV